MAKNTPPPPPPPPHSSEQRCSDQVFSELCFAWRLDLGLIILTLLALTSDDDGRPDSAVRVWKVHRPARAWFQFHFNCCALTVLWRLLRLLVMDDDGKSYIVHHQEGKKYSWMLIKLKTKTHDRPLLHFILVHLTLKHFKSWNKSWNELRLSGDIKQRDGLRCEFYHLPLD